MQVTKRKGEIVSAIILVIIGLSALGSSFVVAQKVHQNPKEKDVKKKIIVPVWANDNCKPGFIIRDYNETNKPTECYIFRKGK